jgi:hypothetical protein
MGRAVLIWGGHRCLQIPGMGLPECRLMAVNAFS